MENRLPLPFAAELAMNVKSRTDVNGMPTISPTADDDVSGQNTYTDD
jgi:hypothetical protein